MQPAVRHTLVRLGAAYALAWTSTSMVAGPGSAAFVKLTGQLGHAGVFIALLYVSGAAGAAIGGRVMDRFGRKPPLMAAYLISASGYLIAGSGVARSSTAVFVLGTALFAAAFGTINLTRLAAAEMFPAAERGRGVAWIQISAIFGAIIGPLLLLASEPLGRVLTRPALELVWFLAPPLLLLSALLLRGSAEPRALAALVAVPEGATTGSSAPDAATRQSTTALIVTGTTALAASQAAMAAVMGVAGAAVSHAGHGVGILGGVMLFHFVGMFGLSRLVGRIADRAGRRATIFTGLVLLAAGGIVVVLVPGMPGLAAGLLLVGLGWSFGFIGATVLLTDVTPPARRARTLGRADLVAQLSSALVALGGGWWFASHGVAGLGMVALAVAALPVLFVWLVRESQPGRYVAAP